MGAVPIQPPRRHEKPRAGRPGHMGRVQRSRGSVAISVTIAFSALVVLLVGIELGYLFYQKRELQKAVDLAALAGAQVVEAHACDAARAAAKASANGTGETDPRRNLPRGFSLGDEHVTCGKWDASHTEPTRFKPNEAEFNAVQVAITAAPPPLLPFFPGTREIAVQAVAAKNAPMASFSVGSKLATVGDSLLGEVLKTLGLDLGGTSLVGYDGLADVTITPGGLLAALGIPVAADLDVGEFNALLAAHEVSLGALLDAVVQVAGQDGLLGTNLALLQALEAQLGISDLMVRLGSDGGVSGLFAEVVAPTTSAALNTSINALNLLQTAIGVATSQRAVDLDLGLLPSHVVTAKVAVIEPPSIGIGGVGATAYTAQVRTFVDIDTQNLPIVGSLLRLKLPLIIDVVNGKGTITELCSADLRTPGGVERAEIEVDASVAKICVGKLPEPLFSTSASCEQGLQDEQLLKVSLLGANVVSLNTHFDIDALPRHGSVVLAEGESATVGNDLLLGTTLKNVSDALLAALVLESIDRGQTPSLAQRRQMATDLWNALDSTPCGSRNCRIAAMQEIQAQLDEAGEGLGGFLGGLVGNTLDLLGELVTLDVLGLLGSVGNLLGGLLGGVADLLGGLLDVLITNQCTGGGLIGGILGSQGSDNGCINELTDLLGKSSSGNGKTKSNALLALVGFVFQLLQPILDGLGSHILTPLLRDVLGVNLGQVDVELKTLDCRGRAGLVF